MSGQLRWQRHRLSHVIAPETSGHQSQQTWHEPDALRCHGNSLLLRPRGTGFSRFGVVTLSP